MTELHGYTRIYLFRLIPLHRAGQGIVVAGHYDEQIWWEGFKRYNRWVQILILLGLIKLEIHLRNQTVEVPKVI